MIDDILGIVFVTMDELYRLHYSSVSCPLDSQLIGDDSRGVGVGVGGVSDNHIRMVSQQPLEMSEAIKDQIGAHQLYPNLLHAYIECRKVGAPPEMASLLEKLSRHEQLSIPIQMGADPELDHFMKSYCHILHKYKEEISKPLKEANDFLSSIESQLNHLCKQNLPSNNIQVYYDEGDAVGAGPSTEDPSCGELEGRRGCHQLVRIQSHVELKSMLVRKYSGYLGCFRKEFFNKRKKGKLPKDATTALMEWWNRNYRWPYPTESEKSRLCDLTGLDAKQLNNWFINQRKRHWRLAEDMRLALMEGGNEGINAEDMEQGQQEKRKIQECGDEEQL